MNGMTTTEVHPSTETKATSQEYPFPTDNLTEAEIAARMAKEPERLRRLATYETLWPFELEELARAGITPVPQKKFTADTSELTVTRRGRKTVVEEDPERKRRHSEAIAYVASYTGTWGLPIDIRANPKWGTKWLRLTDGQVEALLKGKERDAERAQQLATDPRYVQAVEIARTWTGEGFRGSMGQRVRSGGTLSANMVEAILRIGAEQAEVRTNSGVVAQTPQRVDEGWYMVGETPWKVQRAVNGSGNLYGKRLTADGWVYVPGGLKVIASDGQRMTVEQAQAYGRLYGVCAVCGRTLTDETSIANGLGPICQGRLTT